MHITLMCPLLLTLYMYMPLYLRAGPNVHIHNIIIYVIPYIVHL